jgi:hypothetical protein
MDGKRLQVEMKPQQGATFRRNDSFRFTIWRLCPIRLAQRQAQALQNSKPTVQQEQYGYAFHQTHDRTRFRNPPPGGRPDEAGIKLANPDLLVELAHVYHNCKDTILRTLIKELLTIAGDQWLSLLQNGGEAPGKMRVKIYRGQVSLEAAPAPSDEAGSSSVRYYRGVKVTV